ILTLNYIKQYRPANYYNSRENSKFNSEIRQNGAIQILSSQQKEVSQLN
ncbi:45022_t:CDS:1, partial [Gigaspora margarita]